MVLTRPAEQAPTLLNDLHSRGVQALNLPLIQISPVADTSAMQQAWATVADWNWIIFVSPSAVDCFFQFAADRHPLDSAAMLSGVRFAGPGAGTLGALLRWGIDAEKCVIPAADASEWDSEHLWQAMQHVNWAEQRVLMVKGDGGREWLGEQLLQAGAKLTGLQAYEKKVPSWDATQRHQAGIIFQNPEQYTWVFSSSFALRGLPSLVESIFDGMVSWNQLAPRLNVCVTHPKIADTAQILGIHRYQIIRPGVEGVIALM
jgi:uroporphyrinogen-III synthase